MNSETCQIYATCGVKALIICENEFLVLSKPLWFQKLGIKWNDLPGGRINFGEADPRHALARELQEELGVVEVNIFKPLHMATVNILKDTHVVATIFHCTVDSKDITLSEEHTDYLWVGINDTQIELPTWISEAADAVLK